MSCSRSELNRPGFAGDNGYCENFNTRFCDELLTGEVFCALRDAQILLGK